MKNSEGTGNNSPKETPKNVKNQSSLTNQKKNSIPINNKNEQKKEIPPKPNSPSSKTEKNDNVVNIISQHPNDQEKKLIDEKKNQSNNKKKICYRGFSRDNKKGQIEKSNEETEEGIILSEKKKIEIANKIIVDYELEGISVAKVIKKIDELNTKEILDEEDLMDTVGNKLSK